MHNQKRLSFYNKKFLFLFKNSKIILVCPKSSFYLIFAILKKNNMQNDIFYLNIKKRFFNFFNNNFLKNNNSSNLFLIGFSNNIEIINVLQFLKNISYFYIFFNYFYFDINSNLVLKSLTVYNFFNLIVYSFYVFPFFINHLSKS